MKAFVSKITKGYAKDDLRLHSSSATFYIVVSALPLVAILIYALSCLSPSLITELENLLFSILPKEFHTDLNGIILNIKERQGASLVPFSLITAVWGSTKGVGGLCQGIEQIFSSVSHSNFIPRTIKAIWRTLLFYLIIIGSLFLFSLGKLIYIKGELFDILLKLRIALFAIILTLVFSLLYARLSGISIKKHFLGGAFAALGWMLFTYFYSIYVGYALNSHSVYAEMGTIIFFMLWCYFCVNIILIGAEINKIKNRS
ncbi:MAG: YihY/virulence factor BrkB family protein [Ruminococcaceae bacterium]|nr:YihY/virulence factor BrkB family protein [Oscillospiraceae bacterium]